jgi:molybdopterin-guanine dinucleotide biosynthesis protein A
MIGAMIIEPGRDVVGLLLAGGLARRMGGGDKGLLSVGGRRVIDRVIDAARGQTWALAINANGDPARFAAFGLPVVADGVPGFAGPLAGILAGMDWAASLTPAAEWVVSLPTDAPFLPRDLVARLAKAVAGGNDIAVAESGGQVHPVIALWPVRLREALRGAMLAEDMRKIDRWTARYRVATVAWPSEPGDPFFNANTPEDIVEAEKLATMIDKTR